MVGLFFPNSVFKHNTRPKSAMSKCNSDPKYLDNRKKYLPVFSVKSQVRHCLCRSPPGVNSKGKYSIFFCHQMAAYV